MNNQVTGLGANLISLPFELTSHIMSFTDLQAKVVLENGEQMSPSDALSLTCKDLKNKTVAYTAEKQDKNIRQFIDFLIINLDPQHSVRVEKLNTMKQNLEKFKFINPTNLTSVVHTSAAIKELLIGVLSEKLYVRTEISPNSTSSTPLPNLSDEEIAALQKNYNRLDANEKPKYFDNFFNRITEDKKINYTSPCEKNHTIEKSLNFFFENGEMKHALRIVSLLSNGHHRTDKLSQICEVTKGIISDCTKEGIKYATEVVQSLPTEGTVHNDGIALYKRFLGAEISKTWAAKLADPGTLPFTETEIAEKLKEINHLKNVKERKEGYKDLITSLTSQQNWDEAIKIASTMRKGFREMAMTHIARELIIEGDFDKAFEVTKTITNNLLKRRLLDDIVPGFIAEKKWDQAVEAVKNAPQNPFSSVGCGYGTDLNTGQKHLATTLAQALVDAKEWDHAFQLFLVNVEEVSFPYNFMSGCMNHFIENKNWGRALDVLSRFTDETNDQRFDNGLDKNFETVVKGMESDHVEDAALWAKAKEVNSNVVRNLYVQTSFEHLWGPVEQAPTEEETWMKVCEDITALVEPLPFAINNSFDE